MSNPKVALAVYSVRDDADKDFAAAMKKVKEIGYDYVELAGMYDLSAQEIRDMLDATGLKAVSAHVGFPAFENDLENTLKDYKLIGCEYLAIPHLPEEERYGSEAFEKFMALLPKVGKACADMGMTLLYHNHDFEFEKTAQGEYILDYMYNTVPATLLQTEIDTCWVNVAGEDPVAYVKKYAGRTPVVHLKDFYLEGNPNNLYELIGETASGDGKSGGRFEFRPVGYGQQPMYDIVMMAKECGANYVVVEQDLSLGRTPMEAVKMSRDYLRPIVG